MSYHLIALLTGKVWVAISMLDAEWQASNTTQLAEKQRGNFTWL